MSSSETATDRRPGGLRFAVLYVLPTLLLLVVAVWPIIVGGKTFFFRDVLGTHFGMKWVQAEAMRDGYIPIVDHMRAGGQAHVGNPNTVALYPDNLLYLVAEPFWALNAHFWIHLLLAPFTFFWLGRAWGLRRDSAWAGGVVFAVNGYLLSCLNLYNLIAAVVWTPALAASAIWLTSPGQARRGRFLWAMAAVWALLIVAGDPITAVLALLLAVGAVIVRNGVRGSWWLGVGLAVGLGTMLAAPLVLEFLRILALSFRGHLGYSQHAATVGSWHPARILELFLPLAFGRPDLLFWGHRFHADYQPLFYSLYPGLLGLTLALGGLGVRDASRSWAMWAVGGGLFFALGRLNPVFVILLALPGGDLFRLPVKFWLLVAVGGSLLAALGAERLSAGDGRRAVSRALGLLAGLYGLSWLLLVVAPGAVEALIQGWIPEALPKELAGAERLRWAGLALLSLLLASAFLLIVRIGKSRPTGLLPVLLVVHIGAQLFFLRPMLQSDEIGEYLEPSPAAEIIPAGARVVHGSAGSLLEEASLSLASYPDPSTRWLNRQVFREFFPAAGVMAGRKYDFTSSPEGLDSFLTRATVQILEQLEDAERIRILEASGVEWLLLRRELDPAAVASSDIELAGRFDGGYGPIHIYRLRARAEEAQFVGTVLSSANLNEALAHLLSPTFDPGLHAVVAGEVEPGSGARGTVVTKVSEGERMVWEVEAAGDGALLVQRSHLPLYEATVDGRPAPVYAANLHRMAVPIEAGRHVVELKVDRSRFNLGIGLAAVALLSLLILSGRGRLAQRLGVAGNSGGS